MGSEPPGGLGGLGGAEHSYPPGPPPTPAPRPRGQSGVSTGPAPRTAAAAHTEHSLIIQVATKMKIERERGGNNWRSECRPPLPPAPLRPPLNKNQILSCTFVSQQAAETFVFAASDIFSTRFIFTLMCFTLMNKSPFDSGEIKNKKTQGS